MSPRQAATLEEIIARIGDVSDGELMALAGEIAQDSGLKSLAHLSFFQTQDLIEVLEQVERGQVARKFRAAELAAI